MSTTPKDAITTEQETLCWSEGVARVSAEDWTNSGFAIQTMGQIPINGLRYQPTGDTTGWFIWCGEEWSTASDFFKPTHTLHIREALPQINHLLGLPPGYRFLIAPDHQDIWLDPKLLENKEQEKIHKNV